MSTNNTHFFIVEEAKAYGVEPAILLNNLRFWLERNRANKKHIHDDYVWTYNSGEAFAELFPYMKRATISRHLKTLCDAGILKSACYNKMKYDRTLWYTITEEFCVNASQAASQTISQNEQWIAQNEQWIAQNEQPIPDRNTDINTDNKSVVVVTHEGGILDLTQEQNECKNWASSQNYWASCTQSNEEFLKVWCKPNGALRKQFNAHKKTLHDGRGQTGLNVQTQNNTTRTGVNYATHYANNKKPTAAQIAQSLRERANAASNDERIAYANTEILVRND
jgi:hypothetical protein